MGKSQFRQFIQFRSDEDTQVGYVPKKLEWAGEPETVPPIPTDGTTSSTFYKKSENLPVTLQNIISACFVRSQDPQPEGLSTRGLKAVRQKNDVLGLLPLLTLTSAFGLLIVSFLIIFRHMESRYSSFFSFSADLSFLCLVW